MTVAKERGLPYLEFYRAGLEAGISCTHNKEVLKRINAEYGMMLRYLSFFELRLLAKNQKLVRKIKF